MREGEIQCEYTCNLKLERDEGRDWGTGVLVRNSFVTMSLG